MSLELSGTTGVKGVAGSVSAPSIVGDDTNTGISFPAADTIKFSTGGVERMSITNSGVSGITAGITMADQWRLATDRNVSSITETIDANWERVDHSGYGSIGSAMTESSGIFTFPSTGIYLVSFNLTMYSVSRTQRYAGALISTTINNSSYNVVATSYFNGGVNSGNGVYMCGEAKILFDVSNTTQRKVLFRTQIESATEGYVAAHSNENITYATFLRLGDT